MSFLCMKISEASGLTNAWHGNKAGSAAALSHGLDTFLRFNPILPVRLCYFCIKRYVCNDLEVCIYKVMRLLQLSFLLILQVYTRTLFKEFPCKAKLDFYVTGLQESELSKTYSRPSINLIVIEYLHLLFLNIIVDFH